MGMLFHNALTDDMMSVLLQPSLSPTDRYQSPGGRTSAFVLKTLSQSCILIGFGSDSLARVEALLVGRGGSQNA